jgi:hypothetical protein
MPSTDYNTTYSRPYIYVRTVYYKSPGLALIYSRTDIRFSLTYIRMYLDNITGFEYPYTYILAELGYFFSRFS